jgi:hypothetical protein
VLIMTSNAGSREMSAWHHSLLRRRRPRRATTQGRAVRAALRAACSAPSSATASTRSSPSSRCRSEVMETIRGTSSVLELDEAQLPRGRKGSRSQLLPEAPRPTSTKTGFDRSLRARAPLLGRLSQIAVRTLLDRRSILFRSARERGHGSHRPRRRQARLHLRALDRLRPRLPREAAEGRKPPDHSFFESVAKCPPTGQRVLSVIVTAALTTGCRFDNTGLAHSRWSRRARSADWPPASASTSAIAR